MPGTVKTSGSRANDREFDDIRRKLRGLSLPVVGPNSSPIIQRVEAVSQAQTVRAVTAAYSQTLDDWWLLVDATAGAVVITLLSALAGTHSLGVIKTDASGNAVTVTAAGTDTINGAATKVLAARYDKTIIVPDGVSEWWVFS